MRQRLLILTLIVLSITTSRAPAAEFFGIGDPRADFEALSADGSTIVGRLLDNSRPRAFRWTREAGFQFVGDLPGLDLPSQAWDVNADGSVIAGFSNVRANFNNVSLNDFEVFVWRQGSGTESLGVGTSFRTGLADVSLSADGSSLFAALNVNGLVRWTLADGVQSLTLPPGVQDPCCVEVAPDGRTAVGGGIYWTATDGVQLASEVVGISLGLPNLAVPEASVFFEGGAGFIGSSEGVAYKWSATQGLTELGFIPDGGPSRVAEDGHVVAGVDAFQGSRATWIWRENEGMRFVGFPPGTDNLVPRAMPSDGSFVLLNDSSFFFPNETGYIWRPNTGLRNLQDVLASEHGLAEALRGWTINGAWGVSDDGTVIVGQGTNPNNESEIWIADLRSQQPTLAGDYNNNGLVEQGDLDLVLLHWGDDAATAPPAWTNDLPTGAIDQDELDKVLLGWGSSSANVGATTAAVPEPAAIALCLIAASCGVGILFSPRKKNPDPLANAAMILKKMATSV